MEKKSNGTLSAIKKGTQNSMLNVKIGDKINIYYKNNALHV